MRGRVRGRRYAVNGLRPCESTTRRKWSKLNFNNFEALSVGADVKNYILARRS